MLIIKIKQWCQDNNVSIASLEKRCGLGNGTISGWATSTPRLDSLMAVVRETGIPITYFLEEDEL